jgi:GNAT superfamily N-acetyltransferase
MIHIKEAEEQDFPTISRLINNELGYPDLDETETQKRLTYFKNDSDRATFVAVVDDEIAGFIGVMKGMAYNVEGYYSEIAALAVSEKTRRQGIGAALVKKAEEWSLSHGITKVSVSSNMRRLEAHSFYEMIGYRKTSYKFKKSLRETM